MTEYLYAPLNDTSAELAHDFERRVTGTNRGTLEELRRFLGRDGLGVLCIASAGYSHFMKVVGLVLFEGETDTHVLHVRDLLVDPEHRRKKLASTFLHRVSYMARNGGWSCSADVNEENLPAQLLFKACGWHCTGIKPDFFPSGSASLPFVFPPPTGPALRIFDESPEQATPQPA